jgi:hypothetical protein
MDTPIAFSGTSRTKPRATLQPARLPSNSASVQNLRAAAPKDNSGSDGSEGDAKRAAFKEHHFPGVDGAANASGLFNKEDYIREAKERAEEMAKYDVSDFYDERKISTCIA